MKMENPGKWTGATDPRITKEIKDVEKRKFGVYTVIVETDSLVNENDKIKKFLTLIIKEILETMKRRRRISAQNIEYIFTKIIGEIFPNWKDMPIKEEEESYYHPWLQAVI